METVNVATPQYGTALLQWDQPASDLDAANAGPYFAVFEGGPSHQIGPQVANLSSPFGCSIPVKDVVGSDEPPAIGAHTASIQVPGRAPVEVSINITGLGAPSNFRVA